MKCITCGGRKFENYESFELTPKQIMELHEADILQFEHPSSFVGRVVYEKEDESMLIVLSDRIYEFCHVPRWVYDGFREAGSKGRYFNNNIKGIWDC